MSELTTTMPSSSGEGGNYCARCTAASGGGCRGEGFPGEILGEVGEGEGGGDGDQQDEREWEGGDGEGAYCGDRSIG